MARREFSRKLVFFVDAIKRTGQTTLLYSVGRNLIYLLHISKSVILWVLCYALSRITCFHLRAFYIWKFLLLSVDSPIK